MSLPFVLWPVLLALAFAGCSQGYSPNTYASNAAQEEATVQRGVIIGVRQVLISADATLGIAAGGAAGGVAGAQVPGNSVSTALGAIGGTLVGGIGGAAAARAVGNTKGWEYIVQEDGNKLVSVTQTSKTALPVGLHILVISDSQQARIVPDYTVQIAVVTPPAKPAVASSANPVGASNNATTTEVYLSPLLPFAGATGSLQGAPAGAPSDLIIPATPDPASAGPASTAPAPPSTPGEAATPQAVSNGNSAIGTLSVGPLATPVQGVAKPPSSAPPAKSSHASTP